MDILRWSEEFLPCSGTHQCHNGLSLDRWSFDLDEGSQYGAGNENWGAYEKQCYTNASSNLQVTSSVPYTQNGVLTITATYASAAFECNGNPGFRYRSARIHTRNKAAFKYQDANTPVKIVSRIRMPQSSGAWPRFWALPNTSRNDVIGAGAYGNGWCSSGQLDFFQGRNGDGSVNAGVYAGGAPSDWETCSEWNGTKSVGVAPNGARMSDWFIVTALWSPKLITVHVEVPGSGKQLVVEVYQVQWWTGGVEKASNPVAPYDQPFYLLLNLAVCGSYPSTASSPPSCAPSKSDMTMQVDFIRVYDVITTVPPSPPPAPPRPPRPPPMPTGDVLRWAEEFTPCTGANCHNGVDTTAWSFDVDDGRQYGLFRWGNNENQCYTNASTNVRVDATAPGADGGVLTLQATYSPNAFSCVNTGGYHWRSGRLSSRNKKAFMYKDEFTPVRIEARVKVSGQKGAWPAFWMLPDTTRTDCAGCGEYGDAWCTSGEIDIMEARNGDGNVTQTIHFGGSQPNDWDNCLSISSQKGIGSTIRNGSLSRWFTAHVEWSPDFIRFYVDGKLNHKLLGASWFTNTVSKDVNPTAPFDQPFYMILNLAVCGDFVGECLAGTDTMTFQVDWIRVYDMVYTSPPPPPVEVRPPPPPPAVLGDAVRWREDFTPCGADSATCQNGIDLSSWSFDLGFGGQYFGIWKWGTNEQQCYTNSSTNVRVDPSADGADGGVLTISATHDAAGFNCSGAPDFFWRSGRLISRNKKAFIYRDDETPLKIEARVRVPMRTGAGASLAMQPETTRSDCLGCGEYGNSYCSSGFIETMVARTGGAAAGSAVHWGGTFEANFDNCKQKGGGNLVNATAGAAMTDWFIVTMLWSSKGITIAYDGVQVLTLPSTDWWSAWVNPKSDNPLAPYDEPFYFVLNLAICGDAFAQPCNPPTDVPITYQIDWIKVSDVGLALPPSPPVASPPPPPPSPPPPRPSSEVPRWSEEFTPCSGANCYNGLNLNVWNLDVDDGSQFNAPRWGNLEAECYTNASTNVRVDATAPGADGGVLTLTATYSQTAFSCRNATGYHWRSGRINSRTKKAFMYTDFDTPVKIDARMRIPGRIASWPALQLLPDTTRTDCLACGAYGNSWCTSGQMDVMAARNGDGAIVQGAQFGGDVPKGWDLCESPQGNHSIGYVQPGAPSRWFTASVVWSAGGLEFAVDETPVASIPASDWWTAGVMKETNFNAPFDQPFYMMLQLAVCGSFVGEACSPGTDPITFQVDWIRVYDLPARRSPPPPKALSPPPPPPPAVESLRWSEDFTPCGVNSASCFNGVSLGAWSFDLGDGSQYQGVSDWADGQRQCHSNSSANIRAVDASAHGADGGALTITATYNATSFNCTNKAGYNWHSGRLISRNKKAFVYRDEATPVRIVARMRVPLRAGATSLFQMLPDTPKTYCLACGAYGEGWCTSGQLDAMVARNADGNVLSTIHYGGSANAAYTGCETSSGTATVTGSAGMSNWFNLTILWSAYALETYVDGTLVKRASSAEWWTGAAIPKSDNPLAPYDEPFYFVATLAVCGNLATGELGGSCSPSTEDMSFQIDWIKVYDLAEPRPPSPPAPPSPPPPSPPPPPAPTTEVLRWSEEFVPCNTSGCVNGINMSRWSFDLDDGTQYQYIPSGWATSQLQCYTNSSANIAAGDSADGAPNGVLSITAAAGPQFKCRNTDGFFWKSGRLISRNKAAFKWKDAFTPIKIQARMRTSLRLGSQCLFQMLPDTSRTDCLACGAYGEGWCSSGQIDVAVARNGIGYVDSTLHWGGTEANSASGCQSATAGSGYTYNPAQPDYGDWFLVTMLWSANSITITVGQLQTINLPATAWYTGSGGKINNPVAPYDQPFYLVFALAVCGQGALINGNCEANAGLSMGYQVDWVKVYDIVPV